MIAAQGPLNQTIGDFWRMVSNENATMIVTTCRLREGSTKKCEKFWPDLGKDFEFDGKIQVKAVEV